MIIPNLKKKRKQDNNPLYAWLTYGTLLAVILFSFPLLQPKIASMLFEPKRQMLLDEFLTHVKNEPNFNPQAYWKFREFYSPGHFLFEKYGLPQTTTDAFLSNAPIAIKKSSLLTPFLYHQSPYLHSLDSLTTKKSITDVVETASLNPENIIVKNDHLLLYRYNSDHLLLLFVLPGSEMKKANGFFDYREKDKEYVKDKNWVNITYIQINTK